MTIKNLVQICVPSRDLWKAEFGLSLNHMTNYCFVDMMSQKVRHVFPYVIMESGSAIAEIRNSLVRKALKDPDTSHILFVDDDQIFPANTIHKLLSSGKDIVGANIVRKEANPRTNARDLNGKDCVWTLPHSTGIQEVDYVGTGLMLISRKALEAIGDPWFFYDIKNGVGEDVNFCMNARKAGFNIYIDHDLSKEVKHVGHFYWGHEHTNPWIEAKNGN